MNWKQFALGFASARAIDVFLPGLGGIITGTLRGALTGGTEAARGAVGGGAGTAIGDATQRFGFHADHENGVTWLDFQSQGEYDAAMEYLPGQGVSVLGDGVTEDGLPSIAIDPADTELARGCMPEFCQGLDGALDVPGVYNDVAPDISMSGADILGDIGGLI